MTYAVILPTALLSFPAWPYLGWAGFFWEGRKQAKEKNSGVLVEKRGYMKNFMFLLFSILITIGVIKAGLAEQRDITRGVINSIINEKVLPRGDISTDNKAWDKEMRKWLRSWKWPAGITFSELSKVVNKCFFGVNSDLLIPPHYGSYLYNLYAIRMQLS